MIKHWVRYEDIEEKRDGYYVVYSPVFTGQDFAVLKLNVYESRVADNIKSIAESELEHWALKYRAPIMLMLSNKTDEQWSTKDRVGHNFLLGYANSGKVVSYWDEYPESEEPEFNLSKDYLANIYSGLKFTTYEDVVAKQKVEAKERKLLLVVLTLWVCVIPALIAFLGWSNPVVSFMALAYSWYMALQKALALWGRKKKSEKDVASEKEQLAKDHHHYHCQLNPEAFIKLRNENFKQQRLEKERAKIEIMRNKSMGSESIE